jgi:hypothetical protein
MNEKTIGPSQEFRLLRAFRAASAACLAMGCMFACSGGPDADSTFDDEQTDTVVDSNAVHHDTDSVEEKALRTNAVAAATPCQHCTTKEVCHYDIVPCDPPVFVNGRPIRCSEEVCTEQLVCTPCGSEGVLDGFDGIDPHILDGQGGFPLIDPVPFDF